MMIRNDYVLEGWNHRPAWFTLGTLHLARPRMGVAGFRIDAAKHQDAGIHGAFFTSMLVYVGLHEGIKLQ